MNIFILQSDTDFPKEETLQWADGFLLVYSIIDRESFTYVREVRQLIQNSRPASPGGTPAPCPIVIVANKADLIHLRQVSMEEGIIFYSQNIRVKSTVDFYYS